jgi:hypothetical protein
MVEPFREVAWQLQNEADMQGRAVAWSSQETAGKKDPVRLGGHWRNEIHRVANPPEADAELREKCHGLQLNRTRSSKSIDADADALWAICVLFMRGFRTN